MIKHLIASELKFEKNCHSKFLQHQFDHASNLYSKDLKAHFSCVNAIEFSNSAELLASAGDDKRILLWNVNDIVSEKQKPTTMKGQHNSNIFALEYDNEDQKIFSGGNDHQVIVHDIKTQEICDIFLHENSVLGISVHPRQSCIFATACESGQISLYDLRCSVSDPIILATTSIRSRSYFSSDSSSSDSSSNSPSSPSIQYVGGAYNSCHFNPVDPNLLAVANEITGVSLIDVRMNNVILRYKSSVSLSSDSERRAQYEYNQNVMHVRFNKLGTHLAALRAKQRPVIYELNNSSPVCFFDDEGFNNACTLKSLCFAGDSDQYLVSGSDNFNVYIWKIPSLNYNSSDSTKSQLVSQSHLCLKGHRSIVNQCRYNFKYHMLATSGVEKIIKVWCPYQMPGYTYGGLLGLVHEYAPQRKLYTFNDLFTFRFNTTDTVQTSAQASNTPSDVLSYETAVRNRTNLASTESTEEDRIMIAFFDSQVRRQRKIEETITKCLLNNSRKKKKTTQQEDEEDNLSLILSNEEDDDEVEDEEDDDDDDDDDENSNESSSSSSSDDTSDSTDNDGDDNESENELDVNKLRRRYENKNSNSNKKRKIIPLRDRLRNLRHRQRLNLTQETDYINVLDSLNVSNTNNESSTDSSELNEAKSKLVSSTSIEILNSSQVNQLEAHDSTSSEAVPCSSKQNETKEMVKNLNKQKRKIELDEDEDHHHIVGRIDSNERNQSSDDESVSIVKFRKNKNKKK